MFEQPLHNWTNATEGGAGVLVEYYLNAQEGDVFEVNAPTAWHTADRYRARVVDGRLVRV